MKAIILVGGMGTRLRPLTLHNPKALMPICNRPFLTHQLSLLAKGGVKEVMLAAGKNAKTWEKGIRRVDTCGVRIRFSYEPAPLGTGGAIRFAYDQLTKQSGRSNEPVMVLNGDVFLDVDVRKYLRFHNDRGSVATILLTRVEDPSRFGLVKTDKRGKVIRFLEKPKPPFVTRMINAGAYILSSRWIENIPSGKVLSVERDVFPRSIENKEPVYGFEMKGYWNDIGPHATYLDAHKHLINENNRWTGQKFLIKRSSRGDFTGGRVLIGKKSSVANDLIAEGCVSIGNHVSVGKGTTITDSIIHDHVSIGEGVQLKGCIIAEGSVIESHADLKEGTVLGRKTLVTSYSRC